MPTSNTPWITLALVALVVVRFLARELRERRIVLARIYVIPAIVGALGLWLVWLTLARAPNQDLNLALGSLAGIAVGCGLGLAVARYTRVRADAPGVVLVRGSWATVAIWVGALLLRLAGRLLVGTANLGLTLMLNASLVVLVASALLMVRVQIVRAARALSAAA